MMPQARRIAVPALLSFAILIIAVNAWFAFRSIELLVFGQQAVAHTWQVINQVEQILSSAVDAETGNRGYLLVGDEAYLAPYNEAVRELPGKLDHFGQLTSDNPVQQAGLVEMRAVLAERLSLLQRGIELRRGGDRDSIEALVAGGTGKVQMDRLRQIAESMEGEERRLLELRITAARSSARRARFTVALASALDLFLLLLISRYFVRERLQRLAIEDTARDLAASREQIVADAAEISQLNATLEQRVTQRTAELEAINRELEAFSYSVSHDLRAPLRTIDGFSLALEEDYADSFDTTGRDYIGRVRAGVQRMGQLIDSLLQLSRITRSEIHREDFDMSELARSVAGNLQEENAGRDLTIHIEPGLTANGDPKLLQVALENLLGNGVKFSSRKPQSIIHFGWDASAEAWFVRDNGAGFDMYYADKLFNAFNRLHGDKDFKGSGIGLATVARVIRRHHGRIWAHSTIDHGATFWFTLG